MMSSASGEFFPSWSGPAAERSSQQPNNCVTSAWSAGPLLSSLPYLEEGCELQKKFCSVDFERGRVYKRIVQGSVSSM